MAEMLFWGENGEYGPFPCQEDGWPHAGEVVRFYRRKWKMSAGELAKRYSEAIGTSVSARWILKMEQQNKVPTDITRRRLLAHILEIPPVLLGLASLESIIYQPLTEVKPQEATSVLKHVSHLDIVSYEQHVQARWLLSYTGEESQEEVVTRITELEQWERESSGSFQQYIRNTLNSYYQLASDTARHQGDFSAAWAYANHAVRVTRLLGINDFLAAALYRRGYVRLEWAIFGDTIAQGKMNREPDKKKVSAALSDFEEALPQARPQLKGAIWLEMSRAESILQHPTISLSLVNKAEEMIDAGSNLSPHEQILLEGALNGLNEGMYLIGKAASLVALRRTATAIDVLDDLDELKNGKGIARNQARRLAYIDLLRAEASLGDRDYITAVVRATSAFQTYRDIHTIERIVRINMIYKKLAEKHGNHPEVKHLGKLLTDYYKHSRGSQ